MEISDDVVTLEKRREVVCALDGGKLGVWEDCGCRGGVVKSFLVVFTDEQQHGKLDTGEHVGWDAWTAPFPR
jgi:hypothetical protein